MPKYIPHIQGRYGRHWPRLHEVAHCRHGNAWPWRPCQCQPSAPHPKVQFHLIRSARNIRLCLMSNWTCVSGVPFSVTLSTQVITQTNSLQSLDDKRLMAPIHVSFQDKSKAHISVDILCSARELITFLSPTLISSKGTMPVSTSSDRLFVLSLKPVSRLAVLGTSTASSSYGPYTANRMAANEGHSQSDFSKRTSAPIKFK